MREAMLGLSGHAFRAWSARDLLTFMVEKLDIRHLDYWPWNRGDLTIQEYEDLSIRQGVTVNCVNIPSDRGRILQPGEEDASTRSLLIAIEEAEALGAKFVQFYTGTPQCQDMWTVAATLARALHPALEKASDSKITLVLENNLDQRNEDRGEVNPSRRPEMLRLVLESVDSPALKLCFDPCNFHATGNEAFPYAYELLHDYIEIVHFKDCTRYSPALHHGLPHVSKLLTDSVCGAYLPVPVGSGTVPWVHIAARLERDGYKGWLTLDPFVGEELLVTWCEQSLQFMRSELLSHGR